MESQMLDQRKPETPRTPTIYPPEAGELRCLLRCPECETPAWVFWEQLSNVLRCNACNSSFWIAKDCKLRSEHDCGKVHFKCPRCGEVQRLIADLRPQHLRCTSFALEIALPEGRTLPEAIKRLLNPNYEPPVKNYELPVWSPRAVRCVFAGIFAIPVLCIAIAIWGWARAGLDKGLAEAVRSYTLAHVLGDQAGAVEEVPSPHDSDHAPRAKALFVLKPKASDKVDVRVVERKPPRTWVEVTITRAGAAKPIVQLQAWRRNPKGTWRFDSLATSQRIKGDAGATKRKGPNS